MTYIFRQLQMPVYCPKLENDQNKTSVVASFRKKKVEKHQLIGGREFQILQKPISQPKVTNR